MSLKSSMILIQKIIHQKSKTSSVNLPRKLILKSPMNFPHVFLKLILLSLRSSAKIIINLPQINTRDADYTSEAQRIFSMINNVTIRLDEIERKFTTINA